MGPFWKELEHYRYLGVSMEIRIGSENELLFQADGKVAPVELDAKWAEVVTTFSGDAARSALEMPASLSSAERQAVHVLAESLGLQHESTGRGASRHIVLKKKL